jgi:lipopolysaccharide export system ATP-binding protein
VRGLAGYGLVKSYRRRRVVDDVCLTIEGGEVVGLLGPNGAGKTTTFYLLVGLIHPDTGVVKLDGADITAVPLYRRARAGIGYLPQEPSVFRGLTVEENILAVLELQSLSRRERQEKVDELLDEFGLGHHRQRLTPSLSGGERRRVEIARALAASPTFLLLDEPFAGIDPIMIEELQQLVCRLKERGLGVLITDHRVRETLEITDRAYIIHQGRILDSGTPRQLAENERVIAAYFGERFALDIGQPWVLKPNSR